MRANIPTSFLCIGLCLISFFQVGCYNTYTISLDELRQVQESDGASFKALKTEDGRTITVTENSRLGIVDANNQYIAISPFNFTISDIQLVAPDEDRIIPNSQIKSATIKQINPTNTTILVAGTLAILVGAAVGVILSAPECEGDFCQ